MTKLVITPLYDRLLRGTDAVPIGLHQLHVATAEQLCRLHYNTLGNLKEVIKQLTALSKDGYVQVRAIPIEHRTGRRPYFSPLYYYSLGNEGARYLRSLGMDLPAGFRVKKRDPDQQPSIFLKHTFEVNDCIIASHFISREAPEYQLIRFQHERDMQAKPYVVRWKHGTTKLEPDSFLYFGKVGTRLKMPVLLEHDRGSEDKPDFQRKIRAYIQFLHNKGPQEYLGVEFVVIAFSTFKGEARLQQMRQITLEALDKESKDIGLSFLFATLDYPPTPQSFCLDTRWLSAYPGEPQALLAM